MTSSVQRFVIAGRIVPMTPTADARAVMVEDGLITAVGGADLVTHARSAGIAVHDVGDRVVLPGFVDPHVHLSQLAAARIHGVDCRVERCPTIDDVLQALSDAAGAAARNGGWIEGFGNLFFGAKLKDGRLPTRAELDSVSDTIPIVLHCGGHASVLNSAALRHGGIDRILAGASGIWGSPIIELDSSGQPTGLVAEVDQLLPIPVPTADELSRELPAAYREAFLRHGVTALGEMASTLDEIERIDSATRSGAISGRVTSYVMVPSAAEFADAIAWTGEFNAVRATERHRVGGIKMFADGGYSSSNAAVRTPYVEAHAHRTGSLGQLNLGFGRLVKAIAAVRDAGLQLAVHTNGERAQDEVVEAVLAVGADLDRVDVRLEHAGNVMTNRAKLLDWRRSAIYPVLQPGFLYDFVGDFVPQILGDAVRRGRLPLRTLLDDAIEFAASSDIGPSNAEKQSNPLFSIQMCVERRAFLGEVIEPEEAVTVQQALRMHTINAARALGLEDQVGSLEPGKAADLVVLDEDPRAVAINRISTIHVSRVYVAGNVAFEQGS
jgi:predicted amidohydrolase YtcJ